jgi:hypothetical protein
MISTVEKKYNDNEWTSYKMTMTNGKVYSVPLAEDNTDYQEIQQWISEGNTVIDNGE